MIAELTIDLDALRANVRALRALAGPVRVLPVVKANAYGHGLVRVAHALDAVVDGFCVYRADEALALRAAGVAAPVLVLGPVDASEVAALHDADAALTLWSEGRFRRELARVAAASGRPVAVHLEIDTGVTRLGVQAATAARALAAALADSTLVVCGAFTHLAAAEELESAYTLAQLARFDDATHAHASALRARGAIRHAAASAAAILYPTSRFDAIRPGIATYGIWPSPQTHHVAGDRLGLQPALSWRTRLVVVREVEAGCSVGYGCTFETRRPSRIGVLPIGYAEGLPRALSNRGVALVRGRRVPLVGRVCMNMAFLDVTEVTGVAANDVVTLIGHDGDVAIEANEQATLAGTIGFELLARLPSEVPRRYVERIDPSSAKAAAARPSAIAAWTSSVPS